MAFYQTYCQGILPHLTSNLASVYCILHQSTGRGAKGTVMTDTYTLKSNYEIPVPKGIYRVLVKNAIKYKVRFMIDGARINLGTFNSLIDAVEAMHKFKIKDMEKHTGICIGADRLMQTTIEQVLTESFKTSDVTLWESKLSELPSALLSTEVDTVLADGTIVPSLVVKNYLNKLYSVLETSKPTDTEEPNT